MRFFVNRKIIHLAGSDKELSPTIIAIIKPPL